MKGPAPQAPGLFIGAEPSKEAVNEKMLMGEAKRASRSGRVECQSQFNGTCMLQKWENDRNRRAARCFEAWPRHLAGAKLAYVCGRA